MLNFDQIDILFEELNSKDDKIRFNAFTSLLSETENKVDWIYDKLSILEEKLDSENSYQRSIAVMLLANLCKSDYEKKISLLLNKVLILFEDQKFITSRQCIQNVWKLALYNDFDKNTIVVKLLESYYENKHLASHANLIKLDIFESLNKIYIRTEDNKVFEKLNELLNEETDISLQKKFKKILKQSS